MQIYINIYKITIEDPAANFYKVIVYPKSSPLNSIKMENNDILRPRARLPCLSNNK